ncbi:MAG TPA: YtxH domain-containing protein [Chitinophagaceae bacterium]|nr:YtxH domain-containing protein [Chitinophagaceae bacterium]
MEALNNKTGKLIGVLLLGAAIGGILGILFAPGKGSETRKKLLAKGSDLTDAMKEKIKDFIEEFKNEFGEVKDKASELIENGKAKMEKSKVS